MECMAANQDVRVFKSLFVVFLIVWCNLIFVIFFHFSSIETAPSSLLNPMESDHPVSKKPKLVNSVDCVMEVVPSNAGESKQHLQWTQWQILDSILPTGGFAHSYGFEAAMQSRMVIGEQPGRLEVIFHPDPGEHWQPTSSICVLRLQVP
jgi:hypothetical protein